MHGTLCTKPEQFDAGLVEKIWIAQHAFGIGKATFYGDWENARLLKIEPVNDRLLGSFYEGDGRMMLVLANLTDQQQGVVAQFNPGPATVILPT